MDADRTAEHRYGWQLVGGDLALDLANTVEWRPDPLRRLDLLAEPHRLGDWWAAAAAHHGFPVGLSAAELRAPVVPGLLAAVTRLREAAASVLGAHVEDRDAPPVALATVRSRYEDALSRAVVAPRLPLRHRLEVRSPDDLPGALALAVGRFCGRPDLQRLRRCDDADCGWYFLDVSRNRSRRWCDPASCGNRARVRAFAARQRPARQDGPAVPAAGQAAGR